MEKTVERSTMRTSMAQALIKALEKTEQTGKTVTITVAGHPGLAVREVIRLPHETDSGFEERAKEVYRLARQG